MISAKKKDIIRREIALKADMIDGENAERISRRKRKLRVKG